MDVVEYLHNLGNELAGLNGDPEARGEVLKYAKDQLAGRMLKALLLILEEPEGDDGNDK